MCDIFKLFFGRKLLCWFLKREEQNLNPIIYRFTTKNVFFINPKGVPWDSELFQEISTLAAKLVDLPAVEEQTEYDKNF